MPALRRVTLLVEARRAYGLRRETLDKLPPRAARTVEIAEIYRFLGDANPTTTAIRTVNYRQTIAWLRGAWRRMSRRVRPRARVVANEPDLIDFIPDGLTHLGRVDRFMTQVDIYRRGAERARKKKSPPVVDARGHGLVLMDAPHYFAFDTEPGTKIALVIHDLIPMADPYMTASTRAAFIRKLQCSLDAATHLVFVSQTVRAQFLALFPTYEGRLPVLVIPPTLQTAAVEQAAPISSLPSPRTPDANMPIFVAIVSDEPRKNIAVLIHAFMQLGPVAELVIVGHVNEKRYIPRADATNSHIRFTGFISNSEKYDLLQSAAGVIFPSHSEGFGIPIIEGGLFGKPVLCSDIPVFHEITGGLANFFNPYKADDLARLAADVIANPDAYAARAEEMQLYCLKNYGPSATRSSVANLLGLTSAPADGPQPAIIP